MQRNEEKPTFASDTDYKKFLDETTRELTRLEAAGKTDGSAYAAEIQKLANIFTTLSREAFLSLDNFLNTGVGVKQPQSQQNYANIGENMANLVIVSIQAPNSVENQAKVYSRWVKVLEKCEQNGDIYSCIQIGGGLSKPFNNAARNLVPASIRAIENDFDARRYGEPNHGLRSYRALARTNPDAMPFFGIYRGRLTLNDDRNDQDKDKVYANLGAGIPQQILPAVLNNDEVKKLSAQYMRLAEEIKTETNPQQVKILNEQKEQTYQQLQTTVGNSIALISNEFKNQPELQHLYQSLQKLNERIKKIENVDKNAPELGDLHAQKKNVNNLLIDRLGMVLETNKAKKVNGGVNEDLVTLIVAIGTRNSEAEMINRDLLSRQLEIREQQASKKQKDKVPNVDTSFMHKSSNPHELYQRYEIKSDQRYLEGFQKNLAQLRNNVEKLAGSNNNEKVTLLLKAMLAQIDILEKNQKLSTHDQVNQFKDAYKTLSEIEDKARDLIKANDEMESKKKLTTTSRLTELFSFKKKETLPTLTSITQAIYDLRGIVPVAERFGQLIEEKQKKLIPDEHSQPSPTLGTSALHEEVNDDGLEPIALQQRAELRSASDNKKDESLNSERYSKPLPPTPGRFDDISDEAKRKELEQLDAELRTVGYNKPLPPRPDEIKEEQKSPQKFAEPKQHIESNPKELRKKDHKLKHRTREERNELNEQNKQNQFNEKNKSTRPNYDRSALPAHSKDRTQARREILAKLTPHPPSTPSPRKLTPHEPTSPSPRRK